MKKILVFGDSNSWGYIPAQGTRYPASVRWPGVASAMLGDEYTFVEDSISGRTTAFEDPCHPKRCGIDNLGYSLLAHYPIDLLILYLGTNDLKFTDAEGFRAGLTRIVEYVLDADKNLKTDHPVFVGRKKILIVGPTCILPEIAVKRPEHQLAHAAQESVKISTVAKEIADKLGVWFVDISAVASPSSADCLHLSPEAHRQVGTVIAQKIREIFSEG